MEQRFVDEFGNVFEVGNLRKFEVVPAEDEPEKFAVRVETNNPNASFQITRGFDSEEFADKVLAAILDKLNLADIGSVVEEEMAD